MPGFRRGIHAFLSGDAGLFGMAAATSADIRRCRRYITLPGTSGLLAFGMELQ
jgi:hypothetical protein